MRKRRRKKGEGGDKREDYQKEAENNRVTKKIRAKSFAEEDLLVGVLISARVLRVKYN